MNLLFILKIKASGLIASPSGVLWTFNDGPKGKRPGVIYATDEAGRDLGILLTG